MMSNIITPAHDAIHAVRRPAAAAGFRIQTGNITGPVTYQGKSLLGHGCKDQFALLAGRKNLARFPD